MKSALLYAIVVPVYLKVLSGFRRLIEREIVTNSVLCIVSKCSHFLSLQLNFLNIKPITESYAHHWRVRQIECVNCICTDLKDMSLMVLRTRGPAELPEGYKLTMHISQGDAESVRVFRAASHEVVKSSLRE